MSLFVELYSVTLFEKAVAPFRQRVGFFDVCYVVLQGLDDLCRRNFAAVDIVDFADIVKVGDELRAMCYLRVVAEGVDNGEDTCRGVKADGR